MNQTRQQICTCGAEYTQTGIDLCGRMKWFPVICEACIEKRNQEAQAEQDATKKAKEKAGWEAICPPLYRDTDESRISETLLTAIARYEFSPSGLAFVGMPGAGKTRAMFLLLSRLYRAGKNALAVSSVRLARLSADCFSDDKAKRGDANATMDAARTVSALFIDDFGKQKFTERAELDIFDILETRTANLLPTFWTANATGSELAAMLSQDRGEPILRRLTEFSQIVKI